MKSWAEIGFEIETTGDGSPSLRLLESVDPTKYRGESMHHSGGAGAETLLIYGQTATQVFEKQNAPHFVVVGLGLGYIEMTIARQALLVDKEIGRITSFESVPELRSYFWHWLYEGRTAMNETIWQTYEWVARSVIGETGLSIEDLKKRLRPLFTKESEIHGPLDSDFKLPDRYHGIMYDAFSSKTTPHLWDEDFLYRFLVEGAAEFSIFSTYACRGSLKRALQKSGFEVLIREGFQGKRNSTWGLKRSPQLDLKTCTDLE